MKYKGKLKLIGIENICKKCGDKKDLSEFVKRNDIKKGYCNTCLICKRKRRKELYPNNKNTASKYYLLNKENILNNNRTWMSKNKKNRKEWEHEYYEKNKTQIIEKRKNNPNIKLYTKKYLLKNRDKINTRQNKLNKKHPHRIAYRNVLKNTLNRINKNKNDKTINMLGYSYYELKNHIESLFKENMSWSNYGKGINNWEIDHIIPVSAFKKNTPIQIPNCLINLRPLWWIDNNKKSGKIIINEIMKNKDLYLIYKKYCYKNKKNENYKKKISKTS